MTPATLDEGAALLERRDTAIAESWSGDATDQAEEDLCGWLDTHAADLIAAARQAQDNAKIIEAAKALRADYYAAGICCDGGRAMRAFDAAITAATPGKGGT